MPSIDDLSRISGLYDERGRIGIAIDVLGRGGVITNMTVGQPPGPISPYPPPEPPVILPSVTVNTTVLTYPAQMIEAIRQQFTARLDAINQELTELGVTGA